jgi:hypothetical protein
MILMIIFLWWLSGFVPSVLYQKWDSGRVIVKDIVVFIPCSIFGALLWIVIFIDYIDRHSKGFWDKKIF